MSRAGRLAWLVAWLLAFVASWTRGVTAEPGPEAPRRVEIVLVGQLASDPVFASRVTSWFAADKFRVNVRKARWLEPKEVLAPRGDAAVHVWVTLNEQTLARLYFSSERGSGAGASYFLRELRLESGLDEIGAEHVAEVLNLSTLAFLEGQAHSAREELEQTLRVEPAAAPPEAPPAAPPPKPAATAAPDPSGAHDNVVSPERVWSARVGYAASYRADEGTWHGPCVAFELALWRRLGLRAEVLGALPSERVLAPLELRFYGAAFVLAPSLRHPLGSGELRWFLGPALEVVHYAPTRSLASDYATGDAATEARPALGGGVAASWGRGPVLALVAQATVPLTRTHYDVVQGQSREVIGRASPLVPTAGLEIGF